MVAEGSDRILPVRERFLSHLIHTVPPLRNCFRTSRDTLFNHVCLVA